jgi:hypothetical protein
VQKHRPAAIMLLVFSLAALHPVWGQSAPRTCVLLNANLSETARLDIFKDVITDALEVELKLAAFSLVEEQQTLEMKKKSGLRDEELIRGPVAVNLARELGADIAVTGFVRIRDGEILCGLKGYEVADGRLLIAVLKRGSAGLKVFSMINEAAAELIPGLTAGTPPPPEAVKQVTRDLRVRSVSYEHRPVEMGKTIDVTLLSPDEGAEIILAGQKPVGRIESGRLSFSGKAGTSLLLQIRKPGYYEKQVEIRLKDADTRIRLTGLQPIARSGLELEYSFPQLFGLGAAYRRLIFSGRMFLRAENYLYAQYPANLLNLRSLPVTHNDLRLLCGGYVLTPASSNFKVGLAFGAGGILTKMIRPLDSPVYLDLYINTLVSWMEYRFQRLTFFYRMEDRYALGLADNLLGEGHIGEGPYISAGVTWKW